MHSSVRRLAEQAHRPLISFVGKRTWGAPLAAHPHPAAPPEYRHVFSNSPPSKRPVFQHFWEAPSRLWSPRYKHLSDAEVDAISSGGASLH
ncbi:hypothetical protein SCLCIDRAFT_1216525 [Scleroderma citrinum Foug A]|uniref:Uncharacterized protein n=1 Tax=Scleroderma citrinum Foug A TaxID=1036808 RepID=A0A0C3DY36_9AGAM|nr:hypothetical protein SCLCIDRAFT_1216525 [Scleroderma citrinum Foug A]